MVVVRLKGGLGNQMFQYAFGKGISEKLKTDLYLDLSYLLDRSRPSVPRNYDLDIFNIKAKFLVPPGFLRLVSRLNSLRPSLVGLLVWKIAGFGKTYLSEAHFHVMEELIEHPKDNTFYDGYWQSHRYFQNVSEQLREEFTFTDPLLIQSKSLFNKINATNSVCLNVRRTDFLKRVEFNTTDLDYFIRAAKYVGERLEKPHFFIFSDDIDWCERYIQLPYPRTIVRHDVKGIKFSNYLRLMSSCKHFIIPNSSFAWWAVWLNASEDNIVIAPRTWYDVDYNFNDLIPSNWVRL